jgi:pilus assembly protein Flp/PilA
MDRLPAVVARAAERVVRSRPLRSLQAALAPANGSQDRQRGQGLAEYALILGLIAIVAIAALIFLGDSITGMINDIINEGFRFVSGLLEGY